MLSDIAKAALLAVGVDPDSESQWVRRQQFTLLIDELRRRTSGDQVDKILTEIVETLVAQGRTSHDEIHRSVSIPRPSAPVTSNNYQFWQALQQFDRIFSERLINSDSKTARGIILYSAIRYGRLLDPDLIRDFNQQHWISSLRRLKNDFWFRLSKPRHEIDMVWQPDSLTLLLIWRHRDVFEPKNAASWFQQIKKMVRQFSPELEIGNQHQFLSAMLALQHQELPAFMAHALANRARNRGLSEIGHVRRLTHLIPSMTAIVEQQANEQQSRKQQHSPDAKTLASTIDSSNDLQVQLKNLAQQLPPPMAIVAQCIGFFSQNPTAFGQNLKPASLKRLANDLSDRMTKEFGDQNPLDLDNDDLQIRFEALLYRCSPRSRENVAKNLNYFCWFLHQRCSRELFQVAFDRDGHNEHHPVMLMPWEFQAILDWLDRLISAETSNPNKRFLEAAKICALLGFRSGLRRGEIENLRMTGLHLEGFRTVVISKTDDWQPKTQTGNRVVAMEGRWSNTEFELLNHWLTWRQDHASNTDGLMHWNSRRKVSTLQNRIFELLSAIIRRVTGDPQSSFHSLRHSFATINFQQMMCNIGPEGAAGANPFSVPPSEIENFKKYFSRVSPSENGNRVLNPLHQISAELGHVSPKTTLRNYIHSVDLLLPQYRKRTELQLTTAAWAQLLAVSRQAIQKSNSASSADGIRGVSSVEKMVFKRMKKLVPEFDLAGWQTIEAVQLPDRPGFIRENFDGFVDELRKFQAGDQSLGRLIMIFPEISSIPRQIVSDPLLLDLICGHWQKDDKERIQKMVVNFFNLMPSTQKICVYRWEIIRQDSPEKLFSKEISWGSIRQQKAFRFLMKTLSPETE
ncbi:tyrosine-type recombinase/integrase [Oceanobacter mangrovi]|uniref:tyrosine-type recombinase/integrase n=1 Tax=Oceanobacter mangrovi TaxID=2862510 RepID=UPI001C8D26DC|nr:tyrosine-type recombinase/integrase [Oceanobacter mangrovi]